ncbi:MAG: hemerythrin domain-containing protein [Proteobacteria bacterium]|nr:hemerythrin domain-containing protein [Pseudomonadota bacterium]MDA1022402.1 hemerythrin domain-containing protein [Pseudomonadota bacterium]
MTPRPWTTSFEIGHPVLDRQHKELLGMLDDLEGLMHGDDGEKAFATCKAFRTLMEKHFADEEDVLDQAGFPERGRHMEKHAQASEQMEKIFEGCGETCKHGNAGPCTETLTHHLLDHIIRDDLGFKSHLQTKKMAADRR